MIITIILRGVLLVFLILGAGLIKTREMEQENRVIQSYMASMEDFYTGIQSRIEATRKYRHDLAKHIQTLEALLGQQKDAQEMAKYMMNLKKRYDTLKKQEYCSDEFVNIILRIKQEQCESKGIPLIIEVGDSIYNIIEEVDMVALLHNLLDNAIEAQERIPDKQEKGIWFSMRRDGKKLFIYMKNFVRKGEKVTFRTKKSRWEEHGIGTKIIQNLTIKYHGTITFKTDEDAGVFAESIVLNADSGDENGSI